MLCLNNRLLIIHMNAHIYTWKTTTGIYYWSLRSSTGTLCRFSCSFKATGSADVSQRIVQILHFQYYRLPPLRQSRGHNPQLLILILLLYLVTVTSFDKTETITTKDYDILIKVGVMYVNKSWIRPRMHRENISPPLQLNNNYANVTLIDSFLHRHKLSWHNNVSRFNSQQTLAQLCQSIIDFE